MVEDCGEFGSDDVSYAFLAFGPVGGGGVAGGGAGAVVAVFVVVGHQ